MQQPETNIAVIEDTKPPQRRPRKPPWRDRPEAPTSTSNLATSILAVTAELHPIGKGGKNDYAKYTYARMPDVLRELAPLMAKHGILITQSEVEWATNADGVLRILFSFDIEHAPTGEVRTINRSGTLKVSGAGKGYNDKGSAAIATMVRKYLLIELFNCVVDDLPDADADDGSHQKPLPPKPNPMKPIEEKTEDPHFTALNAAMIKAAAEGGYEKLEQAWNDMRESMWDHMSMGTKKHLVDMLEDPEKGYKVIAEQFEADRDRRRGRDA